jgi:reactive intermediate/imine deaminase
MKRIIAAVSVAVAFFLAGAIFAGNKTAWPKPQARPGNEVQFLNPQGRAAAPFSEAVRVGRLLILSGQLGRDPKTGALAAGGVEAETRQALENIKAALERYGSSLSRVVKCTVMLADIGERDGMNKVYMEYFTKDRPARSAFGVSGLAMGARVEIECWAVVD